MSVKLLKNAADSAPEAPKAAQKGLPGTPQAPPGLPKWGQKSMKIRSEAALGHPGADLRVSGHPPAPILGEKVMQNCSRNLCTTLRKIFTHTPATCSHPPLPEHVSTQLVKKPAVPQLRGNAFRQKHLLCSNLLCQGFSARRTGRKPTWI